MPMESRREKRWDCTHCPKSFTDKRYFRQHVVTHDPDAQRKCEVDGRKFYLLSPMVKLNLTFSDLRETPTLPPPACATHAWQ